MRRLIPHTASPAGAPADPADLGSPADRRVLAPLYAYPDSVREGRPWVRATMVGSLDGAAHADGRSQPLSSRADMRVFGALRALADVVVAGAATVRGEGYAPGRARPEFAADRRALGQAPAPAVAVVTSTLDLDFAAPLFTEALVPTVLLTGAAAPAGARRAAEAAGAVVVEAGPGRRVDPATAVRALADRGLVRQQLEGGPDLLGQFVAADAVDELCLTVSPTLAAGAAERIAHGPALPQPARMRLAGLLEEDGFLFTRYVRARAGR